jgi:hypothetical protein
MKCKTCGAARLDSGCFTSQPCEDCETVESKPTHGGKRPNAGRKPGTPRKSLTVRLSESAMARLALLRESTGCGSGKLIEAMILQLETENDG